MQKSSVIRAVKVIFFVFIIMKIITYGNFYELAVFSAAMFIHEIFHLVPAYFIGKNAVFTGYGILGLRIDYDMIGTPSEKLMVFSGGIIGNIFMASVALLYGKNSGADMDFFIRCNLLISAINLIPAYPLDGGRILETFLTYIISSVSAVKTVSFLGILIGCVMFVFGLNLFLFYTDSLILPVMGIFLIYNSDRELMMVKTEYVKDLLGKLEYGDC